MTELFEVGKIVKPHGLKGYVKVLVLTTDKDRFKVDDTDYIISGKKFRIAEVKKLGKNVILKFFNIDDRDGSDLLRDEMIYIEQESLIELNENEYYAHDILDCAVYDRDNILIGTVIDVYFLSSSVIDVHRPDGSDITILFKKEFLSNVDTVNKIINLKYSISFYEY